MMKTWSKIIKTMIKHYDQTLSLKRLNLTLWIPDFRQSQIAQKTVFKCENIVRVITDAPMGLKSHFGTRVGIQTNTNQRLNILSEYVDIYSLEHENKTNSSFQLFTYPTLNIFESLWVSLSAINCHQLSSGTLWWTNIAMENHHV